MTWVNAVVQGILLGGFYALLACGLVADVRRDADHQPRPRRHRGARRLPRSWSCSTTGAISPFLALAARAAGACWSLGYVLQRTMLERSLRAGLLVPLLDDVRARDRDPEPAAPGVLARRALARSNAGALATASWQITDELSISGARRCSSSRSRSRVLGGLQLFLSPDAAGPADARDRPGPRHRRAGRHQRARASTRARPRSRSATAALAGMFLAIRSTFDPSTGPTQLIFAFEAVVIGGLGSLWGTLAGGDRARRRPDDRRPDQPAVLDPRRPPRVPRRARLAARRARSARGCSGMTRAAPSARCPSAGRALSAASHRRSSASLDPSRCFVVPIAVRAERRRRS